jgi:hypothetical protein
LDDVTIAKIQTLILE